MRHFHLLPPFIRRFGMIPESYKIAMTYEEQLLWLCKYVEDLGLEIENIKTALLNIENAVNELDTRLTGLSERVDAIAVDLAYVQTVLDNGYIINLLNQNYTLDSFYSSFGIKGYFYTGSYVIRNSNDSIVIDTDTLFYYDYETKSFKIFENREEVIHRFIFFDNVDEEWKDYTYNIVDFVNQSSSPSQIPNARAVYNAILEAIGGGITINYNSLSNLPTINGVTIEGNLTSQDLNIEGLSILENDTFNVYNLENGIYLVGDRNTTQLNCGDKTVLLGDGYSLLYIFGSHNFMLISSSDRNGLTAPSEYPLLTSGNCSAINNGTVYQYESNILSCWGIDTDLSDSGNSHNYVPSALAVKNYVNAQVGNIETILNNINVGSGVV